MHLHSHAYSADPGTNCAHALSGPEFAHSCATYSYTYIYINSYADTHGHTASQ